MNTKQELLKKYPPEIVAVYFPNGIIFDWDNEYYDIVWTYPNISLVILKLYELGITINTVDVMVANEVPGASDQLMNFAYEGSSWSIGNISDLNLKEFLAVPEVKSTAAILSVIYYLEQFEKNNGDKISGFYFKVSF